MLNIIIATFDNINLVVKKQFINTKSKCSENSYRFQFTMTTGIHEIYAEFRQNS